jgi:hypothetical protein
MLSLVRVSFGAVPFEMKFTARAHMFSVMQIMV